jgi:hypothetical protein
MTISAAERFSSSSSLMSWDAAAVVDDRHRVVGVDHDLDVVAVTRERLVDRVVEHLEHHVVEARAIGGVADVHPGRLRTASRPFRTLMLEES